MKRFIKIKQVLTSSLIMAALLIGSSCEDYLERTPESIISEEQAFQNFVNFQGFTEELYQCVPNFTNRYWTNSWNWGEDEIETSAGDFHYSFKIDRGNFWGWQAEHDGWGSGWMDRSNAHTSFQHGDDPRMLKGLWPLGWYGIRKANLGLANLDLLTDATQEERDLIEGQLLFFRGWFHFMFIQYFGGLPYVDEVLPGDQPLRLPRLNYHESAERISQDLRRAADLLPVNWDETVAGRRTLGKNDLRINKIMALGYLGKNLLWASSPLMNFESTGSRTYNSDLSQRAATAFGELLSLTESGSTQYALLPFENYSRNFYTRGQNWAMPGGTEAIFRSTYRDANDSNWGTSKQYIPLIVGGGDATKFMPTANYVNNYGMANGMPLPDDITQADAESGYDPEFLWRNRDPRFYHDIIYDGVRVVQGSMPPNEVQHRFANLFTGGSYRDVRTGSRTGYANRKFIPIESNMYDEGHSFGNNLHINVPYMRLADIYLMYAEAASMGYSSPTGKAPNFEKTAVDAINIIRARAGVAPVNQKFLASNNDFLSELRRERAVELSFERHRFNDLRRWLLLTERPYTLKTSLEFDRAPDGFNSERPSENRIVNIRESVILERQFSERHNWLPLKVSDVTIYPEFRQNPGW